MAFTPFKLNWFSDYRSLRFCAATSVVAFFISERKFTMVNYKKLYFRLFNAITDAIEILQKAQIDTEEAYIEEAEAENNSPKAAKLKVHSTNKDGEK